MTNRGPNIVKLKQLAKRNYPPNAKPFWKIVARPCALAEKRLMANARNSGVQNLLVPINNNQIQIVHPDKVQNVIATSPHQTLVSNRAMQSAKTIILQ